MEDFAGRIEVVTGAGSGMGAGSHPPAWSRKPATSRRAMSPRRRWPKRGVSEANATEMPSDFFAPTGPIAALREAAQQATLAV